MSPPTYDTTEPRVGVIGVARAITEHPVFLNAMLAVIVLASVVVGLETYPELMERYGGVLKGMDTAIVVVFTIEIVLRMVATGPRWWRFFASGWNTFDFIVVVLCLVPAGGSFAAVARLVRVVRALRLLSAIPKLQLVITALLRSLPSISYVGMLLALLFYIYAVVGVVLFSGNDPGHFGSLHRALLSLLRAVTLEDWTDLMYTQVYGADKYPPHLGPDSGKLPPSDPRAMPVVGVIYFGSFVLVGTMIVLNLFIGVVISSLTEAQGEQARAALRKDSAQDLEGHLRRMEDRFEAMRDDLRVLRESLPGSDGPPSRPGGPEDAGADRG
ncbi:MAG: ion transporter [Planctomycetota bacterium]